jgi:hypothetical protein
MSTYLYIYLHWLGSPSPVEMDELYMWRGVGVIMKWGCLVKMVDLRGLNITLLLISRFLCFTSTY